MLALCSRIHSIRGLLRLCETLQREAMHYVDIHHWHQVRQYQRPKTTVQSPDTSIFDRHAEVMKPRRGWLSESWYLVETRVPTSGPCITDHSQLFSSIRTCVDRQQCRELSMWLESNGNILYDYCFMTTRSFPGQIATYLCLYVYVIGSKTNQTIK